MSVSFHYVRRTPAGTLLTIFPFWTWAPIGGVPWLLSLRRGEGRRGWAILGLWVVCALAFCEEPRALLSVGRRWPVASWQRARAEGRALRVVTANCGGGDLDAFEEAMSYAPDLLLLQERPDRQPLAEALSKYGGYAMSQGADGAIIARGSVSPVEIPRRSPVAQAAVVEVDRRRLGVVNAHLHLPYLSPRFWSPQAWRAAAERFRIREDQMRVAVEAAAAFDRNLPVIVGGDFNTPPGDLLFRALPEGLRDSFRVAGLGMGNTIANDMPVSRIDYVWAPEALEIHSAVARLAHHSDHRLVVADLAWPAPGE